eukprot:s1480_g9.t1
MSLTRALRKWMLTHPRAPVFNIHVLNPTARPRPRFRSDDELTKRLMSVKVFVDNQQLVDNEEAVMETVSRDDAVVQVVFSGRVVECSQRESADRCLSDPDAVCIRQIPDK